MADFELDTYLASKERSDRLWEKVSDNPGKFRMLTGDRPTGRLHIGHYFGSLKNRVELQNLGVNTVVLIADYQVITDREMGEAVRDNTLNLAIDYLAAGIDPSKTIIFNHSQIASLNQLLIPFLSLITESELLRNPTVKAEHEASGRSLSGLLLTYPVHQAADILFCNADLVPVGKDQLPHIEVTRTIAKRFNKTYKDDVFKLPSALLSNVSLLNGLDGRKMSKSFNNAIELGMSADETATLIKKAPTDSDRNITFDPENRPGVSTLLTYASLTSTWDGSSGKTETEIAAEIGDKGGGELKRIVTESVNEFLRPHRERRAELEQDLGYVEQVLRKGNEQANEIGEQTLSKVKNAMGTFQ
jgi:tryptophanyl-tRNA synthetase